MNKIDLIFLCLVWAISAALIYAGMDISGSAYPLFGTIIPLLVSLGVINNGGK